MSRTRRPIGSACARLARQPLGRLARGRAPRVVAPAVLVLAALAWLFIAATPSNAASPLVVTIDPAGAADTVDLGTSTYADASAALGAVAPGTTVSVVFPGAGPQQFAAAIAVDPGTSAITITGTTALGNLMVLAAWGADPTARTALVVDGGLSALDSLGLTGDLASAPLNNTRFVRAGDGGVLSIPAAALPPSALAFLGSSYPGAPAGALTVDAGLGFAADLSTDWLPDPVRAVSGGSLLLGGSLGGLDFGALSSPDAPSGVQLSAAFPFSSAGFPSWLAVNSATLLVTAGGDGATTVTIALDLAATPDGQALAINANATVDFTAETFVIDAALAAPWVQPFGLSWLTLDDASVAITIDGAGAVDAALSAVVTAGATPVTLDIAVAGGDATFAASIGSLTSTDLSALIHDVGGVTPAPALPDVSLDGLTLALDTATGSFSLGGNATLFGVAGGALVSTQDRGGTRQLLLGVNVSSFSLGDLPVGLTGPAAAITLPTTRFAFANVADGGALTIAGADLTAGERTFFDGAFGFDSTDGASSVSLISGLNLEATLPLAALPSDLVDAVGLGAAGGDVTLAGSLGFSGGTVTSASLAASLPGTPTIPGSPEWFTGDAAQPFALRLDYDGTDATFGVEAGFLLTADGTDTVPFAVTAELSTADGVTLTGASTAPWATPFDQSWLASLDAIGVEIVINPGGDSGVTLTSAFTVGATALTLDLAVTGSGGDVNASLTATADQITDEDIVALLASAGANTSGLSLPDVTVRNLVLSANAGSSGFAFELGGQADVLGLQDLALVISLVGGGAGGELRVVGGIKATDLSLADLVPDTAGTPAGDFTLGTLAIVLSVGGEPVASSDLSPVLRTFFDEIYGDGEYEVDLGAGLTLVASASVPAELEDVIEALGGVTVGNVVIEGTIPISWGAGGSSDISLSASIPRLEFAAGQGPDWFRYADFALYVRTDATTGTVEVGLDGALAVRITDPDSTTTDLTFTVAGSLRAGGGGVSFALAGALSADEPWVHPFDIQWLTVNGLSLALSFDATTQGFGLELGGDAVLGVGVGAKQLAVTVGLELNVQSGIPTNFVFVASSTSYWGLQDFVTLYSLLDPVGGELLSGVPDVQLRPTDADHPLTIKFALKNSPNVNAGFALSGSLWVETVPGQPLEQVGTLDVDVSTAGVFIEGDSTIPIVLGPNATITNTHSDFDLGFDPASFSFVFEGDLTSELLTTRLRIALPLDLASALNDALAELADIEQIWSVLKPALDTDPLAALNSENIDLLYASAGMETPQWITEVLTAIEALPVIEGIPVGPVQQVNAILGGFDVSVPAGSGYPNGGVDPGTCTFATGPDGRCYLIPPSNGVEQGFTTIQLCNFPLIAEDGHCWVVPPSVTNATGKITSCPTGFMEGGKCWLIPPSVTTTVAKQSSCSGLAILENGRCWVVPPSVTWTSFYAFGACVGIQSGGTCYGVPPGPPAYASPSYPSLHCPVGTISQGGQCYTLIPGAPALTYPSTPITGCPIYAPFESGGQCYYPPGAPVQGSGTPHAEQICTLPGVTVNGKCYFFGQTPTAGTPPGGSEPACPLWAPFFAQNRCWTIPPTPEVQLIQFTGLCHVIDVACSITGLIEDTILRTVVDNVAQELTPYEAPPLNAPPIVVLGGPYSVPEGGSIAISAAGSSDPEHGALAFAWDLDNDGVFDNGTGTSVTFSAVTIDGPSSRTVSVRVTDNAGNAKVGRVTVQVTNVAPTLTATGPSTADEAVPYTLTLSASDPGSDTLTWFIDWGDGHTSSAPGSAASVSHTFFGQPANPTIAISASDEDGNYDAPSLGITVISRSPEITAQVTTAGVEGDLATLTGTIDEPGGDDALSFSVDWGDGTSDTFTSPAGATSYFTTHVYADDPDGSDDEYAIAVTATNEEGLSGEASTTVAIANADPTVEAIGADGDEGSALALVGTVADAGRDDAFTVAIDWGDGAVESVTLAADQRGLNVPHTYADQGTYLVELTVTDDDGGTATGTATFEVANVAPELANLDVQPQAMTEDDTVTVTGQIVDPGDDTVSLTIDWGDGETADATFAPGDSFEFSHQYLDDPAGPDDRYDVSISVEDEDGGTGSAETGVGVANGAPADLALTLDASTIDEAGTAALHGSFADPGTLDSFSVTIDWGDGTPATALALGAGERSFDAEHVYADDAPPGTADAVYTIAVSVTDDDNGSGEAETPITVRNVAPHDLALTLDHTSIDEHGSVSLDAEFVDPGEDDTFTAVIDWGDGSPTETLSLGAGERTFGATHRYLDDAPAGTPVDTYTVTVSVTDDDTGVAETGEDVDVHDVAPTVTAGPDRVVVIGVSHNFELGAFTDPGTLDTHVATIDWGDGTPVEDATVIELDGSGSLVAAWHGFAEAADRTVTVTVTDQDGLSTAATFAVTVQMPCDMTPTIVGTKKSDRIVGTPGDDIIFGMGGNDRIDGNGGRDVICGGDGNDRITTGDGDDAIDGGDGNDRIESGNGANVVFAGAGNDRVTDGDGASRIEAGAGNDHVEAAGGDDRILAGAGNDHVDGGAGFDTCLQGPGKDHLTSCEAVLD